MANLHEALQNFHQLGENRLRTMLEATHQHLENLVRQGRSLQGGGQVIAQGQVQTFVEGMELTLAGVSNALEAVQSTSPTVTQEPQHMSTTTGDPSNPIQNPAQPNPEGDAQPQSETGDAANPVQNPPQPNPAGDQQLPNEELEPAGETPPPQPAEEQFNQQHPKPDNANLA